jgi:hypothetical protein
LTPEHFINPDFDKDPNKSDWTLGVQNNIVHRPNHGFVHSVRCAYLLPEILDALQQCNPSLVKNFDNTRLQKTMLAMLFTVIGRGNEIGFSDALQQVKNHQTNINTYEQGKKNTIEIFKKVMMYSLKMGYSIPFTTEQEIIDFSKILKMSTKSGSPEAILMRIAHELDLIRCFSYFQMSKIRDYLLPHFKQNPALLDGLLQYTYELCVATGNRVLGSKKPPKSYNIPIFLNCSQRYTDCELAISSVPRPSQPVPSTAVTKGPSEEAPAAYNPSESELQEEFQLYRQALLKHGYEGLQTTKLHLPIGPLNIVDETKLFKELMLKMFDENLTFTIPSSFWRFIDYLS